MKWVSQQIKHYYHSDYMAPHSLLCHMPLDSSSFLRRQKCNIYAWCNTAFDINNLPIHGRCVSSCAFCAHDHSCKFCVFARRFVRLRDSVRTNPCVLRDSSSNRVSACTQFCKQAQESVVMHARIRASITVTRTFFYTGFVQIFRVAWSQVRSQTFSWTC